MLRDMSAKGAAILDWRTSHLTKQTFSKPVTYVFFKEKHLQQLAAYVDPAAQALMWQDALQMSNIQTMVLVDLPDSLDQLQALLQTGTPGRLAPMFYVQSSVYLQKVPSKQVFSNVYKFVLSFKDINLQTQFDAMVKHLKISNMTLKLILKVFLEAKFVTIDNGVLNAVPNPTPMKLTQTQTFQRFMAQRDLEQQLIYSTTAELETLLMKLSKQES